MLSRKLVAAALYRLVLRARARRMAVRHRLRYKRGMRPRISIPLVASVVFLAGCSNRVISDRPWFVEQTAETRPRLRDGVWLSEQPDCKVDETQPAERWPACASWSYQRGNQNLSPQWSEEGTGRHRRRTYNDWSTSESWLVSGDPLIVQETDCPRARKEAAIDDTPAPVPGDAPPPAPRAEPSLAPSPPPANFCYDGARATAFDDAGRITAIEGWPVFCGPWPRKGGNVTDQPWAGLVLIGENCTAASEAALREAAKRSRDVAVAVHFIGRSHWVRDGYH